MKKFIVLILVIVAISNIAFAQVKKERIISIDYSNYMLPNGSAKMFSINYEIFISKNWSLNYNFGIGYSGNRIVGRAPGGIVAGISAYGYVFTHLDDFDPYEEFDEDESNDIISPLLLVGGAFMLFLPEGINYYIPLSHYVSLGLFVNPFTINTTMSEQALCSGLGAKLHYNLNDKFKIIPHFTYNIFWFSEPIPSFGISLGYKF